MPSKGAEKFGWSKRKPQPRSIKEGQELLGWGMATGNWEAMQMKAGARAVITANGSVEIAKLVSIRGGRLTGLGSGAGLGDLPGSCPRPQ
jgi:CO/xanthine dehydrogenase Mo-binding subunit